jgi:hypothetical protein
MRPPTARLAALLPVVALLSACTDQSPAEELSNAGIGQPSFTLADGFTSSLVGRGNLGTFHTQSRVAGYDVELKSHDNTDIAVANIVVTPGGHSGWHYHPGPALVVVKTGAITFYHGNDPTCTGTVHPAGTAFIEADGEVGIARNEGAVEATVVATFFVPAGGPTRLDAPAPGNCPF